MQSELDTSQNKRVKLGRTPIRSREWLVEFVQSQKPKYFGHVVCAQNLITSTSYTVVLMAKGQGDRRWTVRLHFFVLSRTSNELTLSVMDGRPHLFHKLPLHSHSFHTGTNIYCLVTKAQLCEQLA